MANAADPVEVLAFIESGMSMTAKQRVARWPEWHALEKAAEARCLEECYPSAPDWRWRTSRSSGMVDSLSSARHHWAYLHLIRAALSLPPPLQEQSA